MEDLSKKLSDLLSSPEGMEQIRNVASMLSSGFGGFADTPQQDESSSSDAPSGGGGGGGSSSGGGGLNNFGDMLNPQTIMKIKDAYDSMNTINDNSINLLLALKPHMSDKRRDKVELVVKLIRLSKLRGLFGDFLK